MCLFLPSPIDTFLLLVQHPCIQVLYLVLEDAFPRDKIRPHILECCQLFTESGLLALLLCLIVNDLEITRRTEMCTRIAQARVDVLIPRQILGLSSDQPHTEYL